MAITPVPSEKLVPVQNVIGDLNNLLQLPLISNDYWPILHTPLTVHEGISVTGKFLTTDEEQRLSYVTVLRQDDTEAAHDGLGFAWSIGDGTKYNVYLTDNNALVEELFLTDNYLIQQTGENSFLATASGVIQADVSYSFRMDIGLTHSIDLWIWPSSLGVFNPSYPGIIYVARGGFAPRANGTHFGIAVAGTSGAEWYYDDLKINSVSSLHSVALYQLKADPSRFVDGTSATVKHYGYGLDGSTAGLYMYIYNVIADAWEYAGANTSTSITPSNSTVISKAFTMGNTYRDIDNFINIAVTTPTAGVDVTNITTYYVSLKNTAPVGIHVGGAADVYIYDPEYVVIAEQTAANVDGQINLNGVNGFVGPILNVAKVVVETTGEELIENTDWTLGTNNTGLAYSTRETPYLSIAPEFASLNLIVTYRYYSNGASIQSTLESPEYRFIGTDSLAKIMPPVFIRINNLVYSGALTIERAQELIKDYVINTKKVTVSEIVALLMSNGVSYVDTNTIDIEAVEYDHKRDHVVTSSIITTYSVPSFRGLYTDAYEMTGLVKQ
jgi:hypothetical protein